MSDDIDNDLTAFLRDLDRTTEMARRVMIHGSRQSRWPALEIVCGLDRLRVKALTAAALRGSSAPTN